MISWLRADLDYSSTSFAGSHVNREAANLCFGNKDQRRECEDFLVSLLDSHIANQSRTASSTKTRGTREELRSGARNFDHLSKIELSVIEECLFHGECSGVNTDCETDSHVCLENSPAPHEVYKVKFTPFLRIILFTRASIRWWVDKLELHANKGSPLSALESQTDRLSIERRFNVQRHAQLGVKVIEVEERCENLQVVDFVGLQEDFCGNEQECQGLNVVFSPTVV